MFSLADLYDWALQRYLYRAVMQSIAPGIITRKTVLNICGKHVVSSGLTNANGYVSVGRSY